MNEYFVAIDTVNSNQAFAVLDIKVDKESHISRLLDNKKIRVKLTTKLQAAIETHFDAKNVSIFNIEFDSSDYTFCVTSIVDEDERTVQLVPVEMINV